MAARRRTAPNKRAAAPQLVLALLLAATVRPGAGARWQPQPQQLLPQALSGSDDNYGCTPKEVLLSMGSDATQMHVSWRTAAGGCDSEVLFERLSSSQQQQQRRPSQQQLQALRPLSSDQPGVVNALGYSYLLSERDMCAPPATSHPFQWNLHRVTLKQLEPGATYRYRVSGGQQHWAFRAALPPGPDAAFTFVAFGDMGDAVHMAAKSPGAASTLLRLEREVSRTRDPAELVLHVGDLSYANGDPAIWHSFLDGLQPIAAGVPYMVATGNHEYGYSASPGSSRTFTDPSGAAAPYQPSWGNFGPDSQGECGVVTARRFHMPHTAGRRDNPPFWFAFTYGSVRFVTISTEHDLTHDSTQYAWLRDTLQAVDRCVTPWVVLLLHRPMYVVYPHKSNRDVGDHLRSQLEPLLLRHKVDVTVAGHVHSYYRTCAVAEEECVDGGDDDSGRFGGSGASKGARAARKGAGSGAAPGSSSSSTSSSTSSSASRLQWSQDEHGVVHFVIGSAGRKLSDVDRGQEEWCAASLLEWGFGRFTVKGPARLLVEYVASESGVVLDAVEVVASEPRRSLCSNAPAPPAAPAPVAWS